MQTVNILFGHLRSVFSKTSSPFELLFSIVHGVDSELVMNLLVVIERNFFIDDWIVLIKRENSFVRSEISGTTQLSVILGADNSLELVILIEESNSKPFMVVNAFVSSFVRNVDSILLDIKLDLSVILELHPLCCLFVGRN